MQKFEKFRGINYDLVILLNLTTFIWLNINYSQPELDGKITVIRHFIGRNFITGTFQKLSVTVFSLASQDGCLSPTLKFIQSEQFYFLGKIS